jgi:hypothetical protein
MGAQKSISGNLANLSRVMAWLSTIGFILLPVMIAYTFLEPEHSQWLMFDFDHLRATLNGTIPRQYRMLALGCALIPTAFHMWALWSLRVLFLLHAKGEVFSSSALRALSYVAIALFAGVIAGFVAQGPISLALTWPNGPHHRFISLSFGTGDVATLFMAGVVLVIARVMGEARRIADENAKFI